MQGVGNYWWIGLIVFGVVVALGIIIGFIVESDIMVGLYVGLIIGIIYGITGTIAGINIPAKQVPSGIYEYQITILDDVKMTEFNEKYEIIMKNMKIIKQEGKIYTVRLRENKEGN